MVESVTVGKGGTKSRLASMVLCCRRDCAWRFSWFLGGGILRGPSRLSGAGNWVLGSLVCGMHNRSIKFEAVRGCHETIAKQCRDSLWVSGGESKGRERE
jgi:hypothetical protein